MYDDDRRSELPEFVDQSTGETPRLAEHELNEADLKRDQLRLDVEKAIAVLTILAMEEDLEDDTPVWLN